jgi:hypothetical protein
MPSQLYVALAGLVGAYLLLIESGKRFFRFGSTPATVPRLAAGARHLRRRTHRFGHP